MYGPSGLAGLQFNNIGELEFGYDQGVITNVLVMSDFMACFPLTPFQKGFMTACLKLVIFLIGSIFQTLSTTLTHLFIGCLLSGFGVGALSMLAVLYISKISPPNTGGNPLSGLKIGVTVRFETETSEHERTWCKQTELATKLVGGSEPLVEDFPSSIMKGVVRALNTTDV
ncbi:hypothetical protein BJ165DRAFT_1401516 [Panaeolus papilionaceus]|nr:hypothetical protein BJ165DRAFT_1401516 [Panaeolus papilionaceus]